MAEPTGSIIRMPKVENALGQSTTNAASQKAVTDGINQAKSAASTADGKAVTAQNTATAAQAAANGAKTAADNAQKTANEAKTAAGVAQTAANNANNNANGRVPTGRKINGMDLTADRNLTAAQVGALTQAEGDARYQLKGQSSGVTLGTVERWYSRWSSAGASLDVDMVYAAEVTGPYNDYPARFVLPSNVVICNQGSEGRWSSSKRSQRAIIQYRKITGGI